MLQIVTGKYFRPVKLYETLHRRALYTNYRIFRDTVWTIPVGTLRFSTSSAGLATITAEILEQLESVTEANQPEVLISTAGEDLIADVADVFAFAFDVICSPNHDLANRLIISPGVSANAGRMRDRQLPRTFNSSVIMQDGDEQVLNDLITKLVGLDRNTYERFMRAIRRCVIATHRVADDISLAYTLMVAALESLAHLTEPKPAEWADYPADKRLRVDEALADASEPIKDAVHAAILQNEHLGLSRKFIDFTLGHIQPSFYREDATQGQLPIKAIDIPPALAEAYAIRSRTMHQLHTLAPEMSSLGKFYETAWVEGKTLLTIAGLHRLTRHVILTALDRAEPGTNEDFNYRKALPGIIRGRLAPQYWIWRTDGFQPVQAHGRLAAFIEQLLPVLAGRPDAELTDLRPLLELYEKSVAGTSSKEKRSMLGLYYLWHHVTSSTHRLDGAEAFMRKHEAFISEPHAVSLALLILMERKINWPLETVLAVESDYWRTCKQKNALRFPPEVEAGMAMFVAERLEESGQIDEALKAADRAVGAMPGVARIMEYEEALRTGSKVPYTLLGLIIDKKLEPADTSNEELPAP
ncbi:hypothetical protein [Croceicoccus bisphenolivorans]|uniref:hypothetical protein n=1 Tax=Croceicoccus bisphenolivorans TaxID=1783232 RepID=UPI000AC82035|nr:hypothetical protein [Croceicoccus bisphenolivorans]